MAEPKKIEGQTMDSNTVKAKRNSTTQQVQAIGTDTGKHTYDDEEVYGFAQLINAKLANDPELAHVMPIKTDDKSLFAAFKDGILLCKLINIAMPGTIDPRAINVNKGDKKINIFKEKENLVLGLKSAGGIGCIMVSITHSHFSEGRAHIILGLLWQILKIQEMQSISLANHPYLIRLKKEDETLEDLLALPPEELLLRWFNYHLKNAGSKREVHNFTKDVQDGENYTHLLNQLDSKCDLSELSNPDQKVRAEKNVKDANSLGIPQFMREKDITSGNQKLNLLFCAEIFNKCPGLIPTEEEKYEMAKLLDDDEGDSREERTFRLWMNSLGIEGGFYVNNLFADIQKDACVLLKVIDKVKPGSVDWKKKVEKQTKHKIGRVHNANYAIELGKAMGFVLIGIGGIDLVDGNKKLTLAYVWQLVRFHTLLLLDGWTEQKLLEWALGKVKKDPKPANFKEKSWATGQFLFNLLYAIEPRAINQELVTAGSNDEEIAMNAKYIISVARKLGAVIFLTWEDIKDVKPKMITTLVGALAIISEKGTSEEMPDIFDTETTQN